MWFSIKHFVWTPKSNGFDTHTHSVKKAIKKTKKRWNELMNIFILRIWKKKLKFFAIFINAFPGTDSIFFFGQKTKREHIRLRRLCLAFGKEKQNELKHESDAQELDLSMGSSWNRARDWTKNAPSLVRWFRFSRFFFIMAKFFQCTGAACVFCFALFQRTYTVC